MDPERGQDLGRRVRHRSRRHAGGGPYTTQFTIAESTILPAVTPTSPPVVFQFRVRERDDDAATDDAATDGVPLGVTATWGVNAVIFE